MRSAMAATRDGKLLAMDFEGDFNTAPTPPGGRRSPTACPSMPQAPTSSRITGRKVARCSPIPFLLAPFAASACRRRSSPRSRCSTCWPRSSASTRWNSASAMRSPTIRRPSPARSWVTAWHPPVLRGAALRLAQGPEGCPHFNRGTGPLRRGGCRRHVLWLRQHFAPQPLHHPPRSQARWTPLTASGCRRYRAGVEHSHRPDRGGCRRPAAGAGRSRLGRHRPDARLRQDFRLATNSSQARLPNWQAKPCAASSSVSPMRVRMLRWRLRKDGCWSGNHRPSALSNSIVSPWTRMAMFCVRRKASIPDLSP